MEPKKGSGKERQRVVVGETNRQKQKASDAPKGRDPTAFAPKEASTAAANPERMMSTTKSLEAKDTEVKEAAQQRKAAEEMKFGNRGPQTASKKTVKSAPERRDPLAAMRTPNDEMYVTTKQRPNERMDAHEAELRKQRDAARLDNIRMHEGVIADLVETREKRDATKEEKRAALVRQQRDDYAKAIEQRRARDSRASGHTQHDASVASSFDPNSQPQSGAMP